MSSLAPAYRRLADALEEIAPGPPVAHVYNPLVYAREPFERYLERAAGGEREVLLLGMNPGPFGMAQTGVPFGAVPPVRDWLGISGAVGKPPHEHPRRPVLGFECRRCEVSGDRLWGWARQHFDEAGRFLSRFAVINYCPLLFLDQGGRNLVPAQLAAADRRRVEEPCDETLREVLATLRPRFAVGIGKYAEQKLRRLAPDGMTVGSVLHPSPASPAANRGWAQEMTRGLRELGVEIP